jgi:hypothetical protein
VDPPWPAFRCLPRCRHNQYPQPRTPFPSYNSLHLHLHTQPSKTLLYIQPHPYSHIYVHTATPATHTPTTPGYPMQPPVPARMATRLAPQHADPHHYTCPHLPCLRQRRTRSFPVSPLRRRVVVLHNHSGITRLASETRSQEWTYHLPCGSALACVPLCPAPTNQYPQPRTHPAPTPPPTHYPHQHLHTKTPKTLLYIHPYSHIYLHTVTLATTHPRHLATPCSHPCLF